MLILMSKRITLYVRSAHSETVPISLAGGRGVVGKRQTIVLPQEKKGKREEMEELGLR